MTSVSSSFKMTRQTILELLYNSQASHLGSCLSVIDILDAIYSSINKEFIMNHDLNRDFIIVSKGHCAAAVYSALFHHGLISKEEIATYHSKNSLLHGHVSHKIFGVEHSTGALGHGLSVGVGIAIGKKTKNLSGNIYVVMGDGEIQEGSIWEALMLASTLNLSNLKILIDYNKISSITFTEKVIHTGNLKSRFEGFGVNVYEIDGHDKTEIMKSISNKNNSKPEVIICHTIKGKGISFAENQPIWHYRSLNHEMKEIAFKELE